MYKVNGQCTKILINRNVTNIKHKHTEDYVIKSK